jgi:hypothetical protein
MPYDWIITMTISVFSQVHLLFDRESHTDLSGRYQLSIDGIHDEHAFMGTMAFILGWHRHRSAQLRPV